MPRRANSYFPEKIETFRTYLRLCLSQRNITLHTLNKMTQRSPNCYSYLLSARTRAVPGPIIIEDIAAIIKCTEEERKHLHYLAARAIGYDI